MIKELNLSNFTKNHINKTKVAKDNQSFLRAIIFYHLT